MKNEKWRDFVAMDNGQWIMEMIRRFFAAAALTIMAASAMAAEISVAADSSIADALKKAREMRRLNKTAPGEVITINLAPTTYRLYEPITLRTEDHDLVIQGNGKTAVSGGMKIENWKQENGLWTADIPDFKGRPMIIRQLWVNGKKADKARDVSDFEKMSRIRCQDKQNQILWVPAQAVRKIMNGDSTAFTVQPPEMVLHEMWSVAYLRIKSIAIHGDSAAVRFMQPEAKLQATHPWPNVMTGEHASPFYITGSKQLLDQPGEWFYDRRQGKIYYMPRQGESIATAEAEIPVLETLVNVEGNTDNIVKNVSFEGITFCHTTWIRPELYGHVPLQAGMFLTEAYKLRPQMEREDNHKLDNQGWLGKAKAAIIINGGESINFNKCIFTHLGGNGIDYNYACKNGKTENCTFTDIAMNAYVCGSFSPASLETHIVYDPKDSREVCQGNSISKCTINNIGNEDWGCCAITAGYVAEQKITDNVITDVPYSAISLGWGWNRHKSCMHDNYVAGNKITFYGKHCYDCAGIYTLGNQPGTIIEKNSVTQIYKPSYVHDPNHWFYLYTDEGSSNITVRNNHTEAEKFLKNACGPNNVWENNGPEVEIKN